MESLYSPGSSLFLGKGVVAARIAGDADRDDRSILAGRDSNAFHRAFGVGAHLAGERRRRAIVREHVGQSKLGEADGERRRHQRAYRFHQFAPSKYFLSNSGPVPLGKLRG